jgi:hypothetical protein
VRCAHGGRTDLCQFGGDSGAGSRGLTRLAW